MPLHAINRKLRSDLTGLRTKGSFARHAAQAFSGVALVTLSQVLLTPLIARLYGPESYSVYGIFLALSTNLVLVAELGYTSAYVLPREEDRFLDLARINLFLLGALVVVLIPVCLAKDLVYRLVPDWAVMGDWLYLLPLGVVVQALPIIFTHWLTRARAFGRSAYLGGATNIGLRLFNLGYGALSKGSLTGLIVGELVVRLVAVPFYLWSLVPAGIRRLREPWDRRRMLAVAKEYRRYPLFIFPERWVGLMGMQAPIYLLAGSLTLVGKFTMANGLLLLPLRLLGYSFGNVYLQKAKESWDKGPAELGRVTWELFQRLLLFGLLPFMVLTVVGDHLFGLFLGERWAQAGVMAALLGPFFFFRLLTEPIQTVLNVVRREHVMITFQGIMLVLRWGAMLGVLALTHAPVAGVAAFCVVCTLGQLVLMAIILHHAHAPWRRGVLLAVVPTAAVLLALMALRHLLIGSWFPELDLGH